MIGLVDCFINMQSYMLSFINQEYGFSCIFHEQGSQSFNGHRNAFTASLMREAAKVYI